MSVKLIDTAGSEKFFKIGLDKKIKEADGILFVYNITDKESLELFYSRYFYLIKEHKKANIPIAFCGNNIDLEEYRKIPFEKANQISSENNYIFMETSCERMENVKSIFETLISSTLENAKKKNYINNGIFIDKIRKLLKGNFGLFSSSKKNEEKNLLEILKHMSENEILYVLKSLIKKNENQKENIDYLEKELKRERDNSKKLNLRIEENKKTLKDFEKNNKIFEKLNKNIENLENELK